MTKIKEEKAPEIYAIAGIYGLNKNLVGLRLLDINSSKKTYSDASIDGCIKVLRNMPNAIENIRLDQQGKIRLVNGILSNLTKINSKGAPLEYIDYNGRKLIKAPILVANQIGNLGYTVIGHTGEIRRVPIDKLIEEAKVLGVANGIIQYIPEQNMEFIIGIEEPYKIQQIAKSKTGSVGVTNMRVAMPNAGTSRIAKSTEVEVENQLNYNDVFKSMTSAQKKCIQNFYMWYTIDLYKSIAKSTKFQINLDKAAKLAQLRRDQEWEFGGIVDTGFLGASKCTLGHSLRYEYHAVVFDDKGGVINRVIFGETCSSDFFNIDIEDMRKLVKVRKKMSEEIDILTEYCSNDKLDILWEKVGLLRNCVLKLGKEETLSIFGQKLGGTLLNFIAHNIPFTESLTKLARCVAYGSAEYGKGTGRAFWERVFPEYRAVIDRVYKGKVMNTAVKYLIEYLNFMCGNKLSGEYAYNPLEKTGKGEGSFNAAARSARTLLNSRIGYTILCREFTIEEISSLLKVVSVIYAKYDRLMDITDLEDINSIKEDALSIMLNNKGNEKYEIARKVTCCLVLMVQNNAYFGTNDWDRSKFSTIKLFEEYIVNTDIEAFIELRMYWKDKKIKEAEILQMEEKQRLERISKQAMRNKYTNGAKVLEKHKEAFLLGEEEFYLGIYKSPETKVVRDRSELFIVVATKKIGEDIVTLQFGDIDTINVSGCKKLEELDGIEELTDFVSKLVPEQANGLVRISHELRDNEKTVEMYSEYVSGVKPTEETIMNIIKEKRMLEINKVKMIEEYFKEQNITPDDLEVYYDKISYDICKRGLKYDSLSYKQKYIIDDSFRRLIEKKDSEKKQADDNKITPTAMNKINNILAMADESTELGRKILTEVEVYDPIAMSIIRSVKKTNRVSEKQLKHINNVSTFLKSKNWAL